MLTKPQELDLKSSHLVQNIAWNVTLESPVEPSSNTLVDELNKRFKHLDLDEDDLSKFTLLFYA